MRFEPIGPVEATEFELAGAAMVAVAVNDRAHVMDAAMFRLLFQPAFQGPVEPLPVEVTQRKPKAAPKPVAGGRISREVALRHYPESLRGPRATTQRAVWDALADGAKGLSDLCRAAGLDASDSNGYAALNSMRNKMLVHKRDSDGAWERTREE